MKQGVLRPLTHYVHRPYVFVGIAGQISDPKKAEEEARSRGCDLSIYMNPNTSVLLIKHDSHLESMLLFISYLNRTCDFRETYFGCEAAVTDYEKSEPSPINLMFVSLQHEPDLYKRHWETLFWKVFRVFDDKWIFCYSNETAVIRNPVFEIISERSTNQVNGLSRILKYEYERIPKKKKGYDPLKATTAELRYQLLHAQSYSRDELNRMRQKMGLIEDKSNPELISLDRRARFTLRLLETENEKIEKALQTLDSDIRTVLSVVALLNEFEQVVSISKSTSVIPRTDEKTHRLLESEEIFNVEDGFVLEACDSIGLKGPFPIIIPGKGYYFKVTEVLDKTRVVEMPTIVGPRLGLLPILFRLVSEIFVEKMEKNLFSDLNLMAIEIEDFQHKQSSKSASFWSHIVKKPPLLLNELAADLVATRIGGPAYLYALLRALPSEIQLREAGFIDLQDKLCILRMFLQERGIKLRLQLKEPRRSELATDPFLHRLIGLITDLNLPSEYSRNTHESEMPDVKSDLMMGEVRPIEPSIVANALWDTVFDKEGYLNENAAFLSVLEWTRWAEIHRKTWDMSLQKSSATALGSLG